MIWSRQASSGLLLPESVQPSTPLGSKESVAQLLKDDLTQLLTDIGHDKLGHAMVVAGGEQHWRTVFMKEYGACWDGNRAQCDIAADTLYRVIVGLWRRKYPKESAAAFLDAVHVPKALTPEEEEAEIEAAWRVDIASSDESMQQHYVGSARTRTGRDAFSSFWHRPQEE